MQWEDLFLQASYEGKSQFKKDISIFTAGVNCKVLRREKKFKTKNKNNKKS